MPKGEWDIEKHAESSQSDDGSSFADIFLSVNNSHSISDAIVSNEEDDFSHFGEAVIIKSVNSSGSNYEDLLAISSHSPSTQRNKRSFMINTTKKAQQILDKTTPSSLQRYYNFQKNHNHLFQSSNFSIPDYNKYENDTISSILAPNVDFANLDLLICSFFLPVKVEITTDETNNFTYELAIENRNFESNLLNCLLNTSKQFIWLGILKLSDPIPLDKREGLRRLLKEKYKCIAIFYDLCELNQINQEFFLDYLDCFLNFNLPRNSSNLIYDEELYLHKYKDLLKFYGIEISLICSFMSNPLIYLLDYKLFGLPPILKATNESLQIIMLWGLSFFNYDSFLSLPFSSDLLTCLLTCNLLIFNTYQEAKPFFAILREKISLDYYSNKGLLYINYMARNIAIRISHVVMNSELFKLTTNDDTLIENPKVGFLENLWEIYWKEIFGDYVIIVSIDDVDRNPNLLISKLRLIEAVALELQNENSNLLNKKIKFIEIYSSLLTENSETALNHCKIIIKSINDILNYDCITLIESAIHEDLENALLSHAKFLLETQIFESSVSKLQRFLFFTKNAGIVLIPASFEAWISSQTNNYCSFHYLSAQDFTKKIAFMLQFSSPSEFVISKEIKMESPLIWLEKGYEDMTICSKFKRTQMSSSNRNECCLLNDMKLPNKKLNLTKISKSIKNRNNKILVLGYEDVLIYHDTFSYMKDEYDETVRKILKKPSDAFLDCLKTLSKNEDWLIYITTGRGLELMGNWFLDLENLGFANEYGYLHKDPGARVWQRLFEMDWNWKDIVKKMMESYVMKTPGSLLEVKESCIIWKFYETDYDLGVKQGEELINHLNEIFESNSEIEVIKLDRAVEVRPYGINKGTMMKMFLEKFYQEKGNIGMIVTVGGMPSDEDMFLGVLDCLKHNKEYFVS